MRNYYDRHSIWKFWQKWISRNKRNRLTIRSNQYSFVAPLAIMLLLGAAWLSTWSGLKNNHPTDSQVVPVTRSANMASEPSIGIAKSFTSFDGSNLTVDIIVRNTGAYPLTNLTLIDVLDAPEHLGTAFQMITSGPTLSSTLLTPPVINVMYDGRSSGQANILDGISGMLPPGEEFSINMTITIDFDAMGSKTALQNQAIAGGYSMDVMSTVTDSSDAGMDPAGTNPGVQGDTGGSNDPNLLFICTDNDCYMSITLSLDPNCQLLITPDILLKENDLAMIRPDFYRLQLSFGNGLIISDNTLRIQHVGQNIQALVWYDGPMCPQGMMCVTNITLKSELDVFITGDSARTVYCNDPFLKIDPASDDYPYKPTATQSCGGKVKGPFFGGDWVTIHDCVMGVQDTAKTIIRQWWAESKDGIRAVVMDTIYVLRLPPLSASTVACSSSDTIYCGGNQKQGGPYLLLPNPSDAMDCDTIFFLNKNYQAAVIDSKCGLAVKVDSLVFQNTGCTSLKKYTVTVHQSCYGTDRAGLCTVPMGQSQVVIEGGGGLPIYATCEFWLTEIDTLPPLVSCDLSGYGHHVDTVNGFPTVTLPAGPNCAASGMILPDVIAGDSCNEVIIVKAMVDTLGPFNYEYDPASGRWKLNVSQLSLPVRPEPYLITLEAFDECLNVGTDTCAVIIADKTVPTAIAHPGLTLELPGKLGYINASQINNNSTDNCGIEFILARRPDWQTHWPDFCDSIRFHDQVGPDTIWCKFVQPDAAVNEFEAYYAQTLDNFATMMGDCSLLLYQSWFYDLCRYGTVNCKGNLTQEEFDMIYSSLYPNTDLELVRQIGGGWAEKVPFTCDDACQEVTVELLVMDYWCNWSTQWSKVLVEDKLIGSIGANVSPMVEMSCTGFQTDSSYMLPGVTGAQPLVFVVGQAETGDSAALALLDSLLGGYEKAWLNDMNQYVDANGDVIDPQIMFTDRGVCSCSTTTKQVRYYDVATMSFMTKDSVVTVCYLDEESQHLSQGIIAVNCSQNTYCTQTVTTIPGVCNLDTIRRTFKIWKTCGNEVPDTIIEHQDIVLTNHCELTKSLFSLPPDTIVMACAPEFDPNLSGNVIGAAHPDSIGKPEYIFSDDCRVIGIAHQDKMLTQTNPGTACYLIWRTWYLAEWCDGSAEQPEWWLDENMVADSFTQIIVLTDTTAPTCSIEFVGEVNDTVFMSNCIDNIQARFFTFDTCGSLRYDFSLDTMSDPPTSNWGGFSNLPGNIRDTMDLDILNLPQGRYRLRVSISDHCDNIGMCIDTFVAFCDINRQAGMVHDQIHLINKMSIEPSTKISNAEDNDLRPANLQLNHISGNEFELFQNRPNPFRSKTLIGFELPESDVVRLSIYDIRGRRLKVIEGKYERGFNEIELKYSDLNVAGLLYYQLETSKYSATRRMLISP